MSKKDGYRHTLRDLEDWIPFLRKESGLLGPRSNLELAHVVAEEGDKEQFEELMAVEAQENTPDLFLLFCGIVGLGRLASKDPNLFERLRPYASDSRWRIREAVVTGLQLTGDQNMSLLLKEMKKWSRGNWYERRAAARSHLFAGRSGAGQRFCCDTELWVLAAKVRRRSGGRRSQGGAEREAVHDCGGYALRFRIAPA